MGKYRHECKHNFVTLLWYIIVISFTWSVVLVKLPRLGSKEQQGFNYETVTSVKQKQNDVTNTTLCL